MSGGAPQRRSRAGAQTALNRGARRGRAAWQTVFHFHVHVIPRYADDPLRLPWRPAPGDADEIRAAGAVLAH